LTKTVKDKVSGFTSGKKDENLSGAAGSYTDKIKDKAEDLTQQAKEKVSNFTSNKKEETVGASEKQETESSYAGFRSNISSIFSSAREDFRAADTPVDDLVVSDHKDLRSILDKYESNSGEEAARWLRQFIFELARHSHAEELILYPLLEKYIPKGNEYWTKSLNDHRKVKVLLSELDKSVRTNPKGDVKQLVQEIWSELSSHIEYEEKEIFPQLTKLASREERIKAGNQFRRRKLIVPTRPHPSAPDSSPTLEAMVGLLIAPADKFKDIFFGAFPSADEVSKIKQEHKKTG